MISLKELAIPIIGRSISQSVNPSARNSERWGARSGPLVIKSLRLLIFCSFLYVFLDRINRINGILSLIQNRPMNIFQLFSAGWVITLTG
jgi:hypothetical protein